MNVARLALKKEFIPLCATGNLSLRKCAPRVGMSLPSVIRLKKRYLEKGDAAFIHGNKGRKPKNKRLDFAKIVEFYKTHFAGSPFAVACEWYSKTVAKISYTSFTRAMKAAGIISPKAHLPRREKKIHLPRKERSQEGELIQIDGSRHDWLMCGRKTVIHGAIDDATHKVLSLYMCENECLLGYNEMLRQILEKHGIPRDIYSDRSSVFFVSNKGTGAHTTIEEQLHGSEKSKTQWQEECKALGIGLIAALSPEAKGRVERLWQTLQGRLPYIFRFKGIKTISEANRFLANYAEGFNALFSIPAQNSTPAWKSLDSTINLDLLLSCKVEKKTNARGEFVYHGERFRLISPRAAYVRFTLYLSERQGLFAMQGDKRRAVELVDTLYDSLGDKMPAVEKDLISRYFLSEKHDFLAKIDTR